MMNDLKGFGGKIYACSTAIPFHNIEINDLGETVDEVTGKLSFLERTEDAIMHIHIIFFNLLIYILNNYFNAKNWSVTLLCLKASYVDGKICIDTVNSV